MNPTTRASITAVCAAVIAATGFLGVRWLGLALALGMVLFAAGWPELLRVPHRRVSAAVVGLGGLLALATVVMGDSEPYLRYMVIAIAAIVIASLATEIFVPSPAGRAAGAVAATAAGGTIAATGAAWLAAGRTVGAEDLVVASAAAMALAAVASVLTRNGTANAIIAFAVGIGAGAALAYLFDSLPWYAGVLVGGIGAASVVLMNELARREPPATSLWAGIASGVTPVLAVGALVYLGGRLLVG
ncbi:hypothetical protein [Demequina sp. NBRC 110057]|uniref:hypothetical protein n=1 Tax=Demequina sp. NBRC 110057 TaxID=1570346 RepID=UPI0009FD7680|nr:hypothetical protein [Demequina sp. NBRC 110057]